VVNFARLRKPGSKLLPASQNAGTDPPGRTHPLVFPAAAFPGAREESAVTVIRLRKPRTWKCPGSTGSITKVRAPKLGSITLLRRTLRDPVAQVQFHTVAGQQILEFRRNLQRGVGHQDSLPPDFRKAVDITPGRLTPGTSQGN